MSSPVNKLDLPAEQQPLKQTTLDIINPEQKSSQKTRQKSALEQCLGKIPLVGFMLMASAVVFQNAGNTLVKVLHPMNPFFIMNCRNLIMFLLCLPSILYYRTTVFPRDKWKTLLARALFGAANLSLLFYTLQQLPLGDFQLLAATAPFFVSIIAYFYLKEPFGLFEWAIFLIVTSGIVIVMRPPFLFGSQGQGDDDNDAMEYERQHLFGALLALLCTLFVSCASVCSRSLKDISPFLVLAWIVVISSIPITIASVTLDSITWPNLEEGVYIILIGTSGFIAQILMLASMKFEEAGPATLVRIVSQVLVGLAIQVAFFQDWPSNLTFLGAFIITASVLLSGVRKVLLRKKKGSTGLRRLLCLPQLL